MDLLASIIALIPHREELSIFSSIANHIERKHDIRKRPERSEV
jgi:hypothetical protein